MALPTIFMSLVFDDVAVPGESVVEGYAGQIVVDSIDWAATANHDVSTGIANTGWQGNSVTLGKVFDSSSTTLYANMKTRKPFKTATITVVDMTLMDNKPIPLMQLTLNKGHVDDLSTKASDSGSFMKVGESLKLSFEDGELKYYPSATPSTRGGAIPFQIPKTSGKKT